MISGINGTTNQTLTTDNDGLAPFELDTVSWNGRDISLEVSTEEDTLSGKASLKENLKLFPFSPLLPHLSFCQHHSPVLLPS